MSACSHLMNIIGNLQEHYEFHKSKLYDVAHNPSKRVKKQISSLRKKEKIRVAFIVYDISKWKSEDLYLLMIDHPRFEPILVPVMFFNGDYIESSRQFQKTINFLNLKSYSYITGASGVDIDNLVNPDIVFYGELYDGLFQKEYSFRYNSNRKSLACYIPYCFHNTNLQSTVNQLESNLVWRGFVENEATLMDFKRIMTNGAKNQVATGLPIQDSFIKAYRSYIDVWKRQTSRKKRIIWAPSHTIKGNNLLNAYEQSTFLELADDMLRLADKYSGSIQIAFKPHPVLKKKLVQVWGQKRTDSYFNSWAEMDNTQLEEGQYVDLFMSSDALIHDCMSFMVEYMFTDNPIMFLQRDAADNMSICNSQTKEAFNLHYKGFNISDIEEFIHEQVIEGNDTLRPKRLEFRENFLTPPHGKTACQNIINCILGIEDYRNI